MGNVPAKGEDPPSLLRISGLRTGQVGPIDLEVSAPACACVSGPSGVGKTLFLRAIADMDPHEGEVWLDGVPCAEFQPPEWRRRIGWLPAESQWWYARVQEHFRGELNPDWVASLRLDADILKRPVGRLSTGERQRLALLRLLANRPRVLLLDEPTASLDPDNVLAAEALIESYRVGMQAIVLWVSHNVDQIRRVSQRHFVMRGGQLTEVPMR